MKNDNCTRTSLICINVIYIVVALILISTAAYAKHTAFITSVRIVGGIIACGIFLIILAIQGFVATVRQTKKSLLFYAVVMFLLFIIQFSIACACLALNSETEKVFIEQAWQRSSNMTKINMMHNLNCCGFERIDNPSSEMGYPSCHLANLKCCKGSQARCCVGIGGDETSCPCLISCWQVVSKNLDWATKLTGVFGLLFSVIEIIGVWLALRYRHMGNPFADPSLYFS